MGRWWSAAVWAHGCEEPVIGHGVGIRGEERVGTGGSQVVQWQWGRLDGTAMLVAVGGGRASPVAIGQCGGSEGGATTCWRQRHGARWRSLQETG